MWSHRGRFTKRQISVRAQFHKSANGSEKFCRWSTENVQIKEHNSLSFFLFCLLSLTRAPFPQFLLKVFHIWRTQVWIWQQCITLCVFLSKYKPLSFVILQYLFFFFLCDFFPHNLINRLLVIYLFGKYLFKVIFQCTVPPVSNNTNRTIESQTINQSLLSLFIYTNFACVLHIWNHTFCKNCKDAICC